MMKSQSYILCQNSLDFQEYYLSDKSSIIKHKIGG